MDPHPEIMDNEDDMRELFYSYYTAITGWGGPPKEGSVFRACIRRL